MAQSRTNKDPSISHMAEIESATTCAEIQLQNPGEKDRRMKLLDGSSSEKQTRF